MIAGSATTGLEILEDREVDTVFVAVGGGGLAAGVGSVIKDLSPSVRVLAVQPESCPALKESFDAGEGAWVTPSETICDGTKVPLIVNEMYPLLRDVIDDVVIVPETRVREAIRELALENKVVSRRGQERCLWRAPCTWTGAIAADLPASSAEGVSIRLY